MSVVAGMVKLSISWEHFTKSNIVGETVWATPLKHGTYRLENFPHPETDLLYRDIVKAELVHDRITFKKLLFRNLIDAEVLSSLRKQNAVREFELAAQRSYLLEMAIILTPQMHLVIEGDESHEKLARAFREGAGRGLLYLDSSTEKISEDPAYAYFKDFARLYLALFAATPELDRRNLKSNPVVIDLPNEEIERLIATAPSMKGAEYLTVEALHFLWREIAQALHVDILASGSSVAHYFEKRHSSVSLLGRVCFHLAENKNSPDLPFAFLATYAHQATKAGNVQHMPLRLALDEYSGTKNKSVLLRLLSPLQKAAKESAFIDGLVESGDIYETLAWDSTEAYSFLKDIPIFEKAGIAIRVPDWWKPKRPSRPQVSIKLGDKQPSQVGLEGLVDFSISVVLGERELTQKEIQELLKASENLVFFKGRWIEVDQKKLGDLLDHWKTMEGTMGAGVSLGEAMRILSGVEGVSASSADVDSAGFSRIVAGEWLSQILETLRNPETNRKSEQILKAHLQATLRPYQQAGVAWLHQLNQLQLGGILADDMGLGKTVQIISLILLRRHLVGEQFKALLVVPASLLGNWKIEFARFAPSLKIRTAHPSAEGYGATDDFDVLMTTYGSIATLSWISKINWGLLVADEAQAIKNPGAKQTKIIKSLHAHHKIAMTGTPVENRVGDLWSLFDFVSPGLLGSTKAFEAFMKRKTKAEESPYGPIRRLVRPYILRRLKTDKSVIQDLPDKTEIKSYCQLSKAQIALYQHSVKQLAKEISETEGLQRRGLIFAYLMRFKQICNHPSQLLKDGDYSESSSGKFQRLREICEVVTEKQEKVLVFTQFKEMTDPIDDFLAGIFGTRGLVLHGETAVKKRAELVAAFQKADGPPYFVLSLKAGGTGLNLTAASQVIHFDRWWNPAIENQATDRAFRIGQKKNVLVHKFVCKGTLEEKIDAMIEAKKAVATDVLEDGGAALLTELDDKELLDLVSLNIDSAQLES